MPDLDRCPFCGSHDVGYSVSHVVCGECGAQGPKCRPGALTFEAAAYAWNHRYPAAKETK